MQSRALVGCGRGSLTFNKNEKLNSIFMTLSEDDALENENAQPK